MRNQEWPEEIPVAQTFTVGMLGKPKGIDGAIYVNLLCQSPERYKDVPYFYIAHRHQKKARRVKLLSADYTEKSSFIIRLEGYTSRERAGFLSQLFVVLPLEYLPELKEKDNFYFFEIVGFSVKKLPNQTTIGTIKKILDYPNNPVAEITHPEGFIYLLPLTERFLPYIDRQTKTAFVQLPEGYISAYRPKDKHSHKNKSL